MENAEIEIKEAIEKTSAQPGRTTRWWNRWAVWLAVALLAAGGATAGIVHWQERMLQKAQRELESGNPARALALVQYFLDTHPGHSRALALKARALSLTGQPEAAIELFEHVGAATAEDVHAWARAYLVLGWWSRALPLLSQVLRMDPDNPDALHEISSCRIRLGLLREALDSATRLAQLPDHQARGLVLVAAIQSDLGNAEAAIQAYQQVIEKAPDGQGLQIPPEELFTQYGMVLLNQGRTAEAKQWLEHSLQLRPVAATYYYLGNAEAKAGNDAAAEQAWKKALELDPGGIPVLEALANHAIQKGDLDAAFQWLKPLERTAETRFKTAYLFQRACMKRGDQAAAERWRNKAEELRKREVRLRMLDQLVRQSPYSFWANVVLAYRFAAEGNWQQASDMIRELARDAPQDQFVQELATAIQKRGPLPSLDKLPMKYY